VTTTAARPSQDRRTAARSAPAHSANPVGATAAGAADANLPSIACDPVTLDVLELRALTDVLLVRLREVEEGTAVYSYVRNTLVELNMSLVRTAAARFAHRRESTEDVIQVGVVGLIKAINGFDPGRGVEFVTYALPTITGEMKRFFRDTSWSVHVPRHLQERRLQLAKAGDALEQELGREPTTAELAAQAGSPPTRTRPAPSPRSAARTRTTTGPCSAGSAPPTATWRRWST
jgi:RNA polymerase sigma-B factor